MQVIKINLRPLNHNPRQAKPLGRQAIRLKDATLGPLDPVHPDRPLVVGQRAQAIAKRHVARVRRAVGVGRVGAEDLAVVREVLLQVDDVVARLAEDGADGGGVGGLVARHAVVAEPGGEAGDVVGEEVEAARGGGGGVEEEGEGGQGGEVACQHDCILVLN